MTDRDMKFKVWTDEDDGSLVILPLKEEDEDNLPDEPSEEEETPPITLSKAPDVMTVDEVAEVLRVHRNSVYYAINDGEIPHFKIGRVKRVSRATIEKLLEGHQITQE